MATSGPGLDVPGPLFIGDVNTTEVIIGKERAVVVDNTTAPPTVTILDLVIGILTATTLTVTGLSTLATLAVTGASTLATLAVTGASTLASLAVTGLSTLATLAVSGTSTFTGLLGAAGGVLSDVYANYTPDHTVTLETTGGNMNVLLSPNGTGSVVVATGRTLTADVLAPTTAGALTVESLSNGNINLEPNGSGLVSSTAPVVVAATAALPRFEIGPGDLSDIVVARVGGAGQYFSGTAAGDLAIRDAAAGTTIWLGGNSATPAPLAVNYANGVYIQGAPNDNTTVRLLALEPTGQVAYQNTSSGQTTQTWVVEANFNANVTVTINYIQVGNAVSCSAIFANVTPNVVLANSAVFTLPVVRATNFGSTTDLSGVLVFEDTRSGVGLAFTLSAVVPSTALARVTVTTPQIGPLTMTASFVYLLTN
jgi:hypothetical protein